MTYFVIAKPAVNGFSKETTVFFKGWTYNQGHGDVLTQDWSYPHADGVRTATLYPTEEMAKGILANVRRETPDAVILPLIFQVEI